MMQVVEEVCHIDTCGRFDCQVNRVCQRGYEIEAQRQRAVEALLKIEPIINRSADAWTSTAEHEATVWTQLQAVGLQAFKDVVQTHLFAGASKRVGLPINFAPSTVMSVQNFFSQNSEEPVRD